MRVWIQNPFDHLPEEGYRKQRYRLMADAFLRAGHAVTYFTSDFSHASKRLRRLAEPTPDGGSGDAPRLVLIPTRPYARNVSLARILSHRAYASDWQRQAATESASNGRPDLIIASMPTISGAAAALALGRRFGAKVVIDVQDAWPETFERLLPHWLLAPLRWRVRKLYRDADLVTGVCERYRELVGRRDYYRAYLGIDALPSAVARAARRRYVYAGAFGRSYDLQPWIRKVEADGSLSLDIAANGTVSTSCPRIRQHGYLTGAKLTALLAQCDIGIIPMADDSWVGIPNKFFDYAAAGLRIETSLRGECAAFAERWNRGELPWRELDARTIYDTYVKKVLL